jgi:transposase-like protein
MVKPQEIEQLVSDAEELLRDWKSALNQFSIMFEDRMPAL